MKDYPHVGFQKDHPVYLENHSEETKKKLSLLKKGVPLSRKHKSNLNMDGLKLGHGWNKGIPNTWTKPPTPKYNEDNLEWKGDQASYNAKHMWVYRRLGKPKKCTSCGLDDPIRMYHWANISGQYMRNIDDWMRLCVPCHSDFDRNRRSN